MSRDAARGSGGIVRVAVSWASVCNYATPRILLWKIQKFTDRFFSLGGTCLQKNAEPNRHGVGRPIAGTVGVEKLFYVEQTTMTTRNRKTRRSLRCENLEGRRLMAADVGPIQTFDRVEVAAQFDSIASSRAQSQSQATDQDIIDALKNRTQFSDATGDFIPIAYNQMHIDSFFDVWTEVSCKFGVIGTKWPPA